MFLKDFIGKKVVSCNGEILGYSRSALFSPNFRKITALLCADEEEEDFIFPISPKQKTDDVLIMPRRVSAKGTGNPYSPLLKQVYSLQGKFLGLVSDVQIENTAVVALVVGESEYPIARIRAFGDCVLVNTAEAKPKKKPQPTILLGKILKYDVTDEQNALLFAKGITITPQTLKIAAQHNRLLELTAKTLSL